MAKAKKGNILKIRLKSSESDHCYYLAKNKRNTPDKMELRKYDPIVKRHAMYKEVGKA